jgi:hypothetical protein
MRRRTPTPVAEPVDVEHEERRAAAKARLEAWIKTTGRRVVPEAALRHELQLSHNELFQLLEPEDVDDLVELARAYGPNEVSIPRAREEAALAAFVRDHARSMTKAELEARIVAAEHLEDEDAERLRLSWAEYSRPPLTIQTT